MNGAKVKSEAEGLDQRGPAESISGAYAGPHSNHIKGARRNHAQGQRSDPAGTEEAAHATSTPTAIRLLAYAWANCRQKGRESGPISRRFARCH